MRIKPKSSNVHNNLGNALASLGRFEKAAAHYREALQHGNLGAALEQLRRFQEAVAHYQEAVRIDPDFVTAHNNLAWLLATCADDSIRDGRRALQHAQRAADLTGEKNLAILDSMSAAYAELGEFDKAVRCQEKAVGMAREERKDSLAARLKLYKQGKPFRQSN